MKTRIRTRVRGKRGQRGFALLLVVLIVALLAVVAATLLDLVRIDLSLVGQMRRTAEARMLADGALFEVLDDQELSNHLPTLDEATLRRDIVENGVKDGVPLDDTNSAYVRFDVDTGGTTDPSDDVRQPLQSYSANAQFVRFGTVPESSLGLFRALVYEVSATGDVNRGQATSEVRGEIVRTVAYNRGAVLPQRHAR